MKVTGTNPAAKGQEKKENLRVMFASAVGTVTGSNFLLEIGSAQGSDRHRLMIDCGLVQGERVAQPINREPFPYNPAAVGALVVTHAHLDHVGRIPKLVKEGFRGPIYSTPETRDLAEIVLRDAVTILADEARRDGVLPLYELPDVERVFPQWKMVPYHTVFAPIPSADMNVSFKDAGHILGSAMAEVTAGTGAKTGAGVTKVVFTGDLGNSPAPLLRDTEDLGSIDYLVMESTYGDRNHEPKQERVSKLEHIIKATIGQGGTLVIPAFSIDRTQVLLFELNNMIEHGRIPRVPVFVDSPMAIRATEIYRASSSLFNPAVRAQIAAGDDIFKFPGVVFAESQSDSARIEGVRGAKIVLAGSGMSVGGRVVRHEQHFLPDPKSTLLLVGYQSVGSLGRELAEGLKRVRIHDTTVKVRARVETLYGYSAHKDADHLVGFVATATPERLKGVFVVHGEPGASMHLAQRLNDELDAHAVLPKVGQWYDLA